MKQPKSIVHPNNEQITQLIRLLKITQGIDTDCGETLSPDDFKAIEDSGLDSRRALDERFLKRRLGFLMRQKDSDKWRWKQSASMKYVHPKTLEKYKQYVAKQNSYLSSFGIINPQTRGPLTDKQGKAIILPDAITTARKRYAEHCARSQAMVEAADEKGYLAMSCTITPPSRFHAMRVINPKSASEKLIPNPTFDFSTVFAAYYFINKELRTIFRRFSYYCKSRKKEYFYINTVQPTKSGTPHFHLILFGESSTLIKFQSIYQKYCQKVATENSTRNRKDYIEGTSVDCRIIQGEKGTLQSSAKVSINYISRALKFASRATTELDKEEDIHEAECTAAFASNNRLRLVRYSHGSISAYRSIRKGVSQNLFHEEDLSNAIVEVLDTFSAVTEGARKLGAVAFRRFEMLTSKTTKDGEVKNHFSHIKEKVLNRFHQEVDRVIGFKLFDKAFYFIKYEIVPT